MPRPHLGALGPVRPSGALECAARKRRQGGDPQGWGGAGEERLPAYGLRRALPPAGQGAPLFLQAVRAGGAARAQAGRDEAGRGAGHAGTRARHRAAHGNLRATEAVRAFAIGALAAAVALAGGPHAPAFEVIVLPRAVRDSMRARWEENNRHWDELSDVNTLTQMLGTGKPTQHEYLGCLFGHVARDTLWIEGAAAARRLRQLQFAVNGDCAADAGTRHRGTTVQRRAGPDDQTESEDHDTTQRGYSHRPGEGHAQGDRRGDRSGDG